MKTKLIVAFGLLFIFVAAIYGPNQIESAPSSQTVGDKLVYTAADLPDGTLENLTTAENGLTLSPTSLTGHYLSPVLDAPIPYSALVPSWLVDIPENSSFNLQVRTGTADNHWSDWVQIAENDDWILPEDDDIVGEMITVPAADQTHQKFQFALSFSRYDSAVSPLLQSLRFDFIDASNGPTSAELVALQAEADKENPSVVNEGYPKPPVVSRDVWCTDPACDYTDGLEYSPVTHLLVHHTVSSNTSSNWAATVRAIWYYHTFTRGWGDIGYNYLVDMNGTLYEGHLGGDDVVGIHAAGANAGSMALALIGTFTDPDDTPPGVTPPPAMLNSAAALFAWKADQKDIDVYDAGPLPNLDWGLPCLAGHRDVYGTTVCPGDQAHALLPWLRDEVADRIGFVSPYQYVDELSSAFTKSSGSWNVPPGGCGNNGHGYYAWSITNPNNGFQWGEWRPTVALPGTYEIQVYAPYCITGASETYGANYKVTDQSGTTTVIVNQDAHVGNWMSLGTFQLAAGNSTVVRLTNLTTTDTNQGVWFDAIRLRPIQVIVATNQAPPSNSWQPRNVTFSWNVSGGVTISSLKLQVATDNTFNSPLVNVSLSPGATTYNHTFAQDYAKLYWRVVVTTSQNVTATSQPTTFGIDTTAPTSIVTHIDEFLDGRYLIQWSGSDATAGIKTYTVQYRSNSSSTWTDWQVNTTYTSAFFDAPDGQTYWFRSRATDKADNVEPVHPNPGDLNTDQAILLTHAIMLPLVRK
ncbi:MAG: N-acetylmuramoyl-L-alanine amidase [Candidatus Promineifilaceae bacterium]